MKTGKTKIHGGIDQQQTTEHLSQPAGDISKHAEVGYMEDSETRFNTSLDRLEGHIRGGWSPFITLADFDPCDNSTGDPVGGFVASAIAQCEYYSFTTHATNQSSSRTIDLWAIVAQEHDLKIKERPNFMITPYLMITAMNSTCSLHYHLMGAEASIQAASTDRNHSDFGKFNITHILRQGYMKWTVVIICNRVDVFTMKCIGAAPAAAPPEAPNPIKINIASSSTSLSLYEYAISNYPTWNRTSALNFEVTIDASGGLYGVRGDPALTTDGLPSTCTLKIINNGTINGSAGAGGSGHGYRADAAQPENVSLPGSDADLSFMKGNNGGDGLYITIPTTISGIGSISGGGGGGGGASSLVTFTGDIIGGSGGGGGAGIGGFGGAGGISFDNRNQNLMEGDIPLGSSDGTTGIGATATDAGAGGDGIMKFDVHNNSVELASYTNSLFPSVDVLRTVGGAGGSGATSGQAATIPDQRPEGVIAWDASKYPVDKSTLIIGLTTYTWRVCPEDSLTHWDGVVVKRNSTCVHPAPAKLPLAWIRQVKVFGNMVNNSILRFTKITETITIRIFIDWDIATSFPADSEWELNISGDVAYYHFMDSNSAALSLTDNDDGSKSYKKTLTTDQKQVSVDIKCHPTDGDSTDRPTTLDITKAITLSLFGHGVQKQSITHII